jgi:hypothetical protein
MPLQIRRGTEEERLAMSVPLAPGELLYVTDDKRIFVGDGISVGPGLIPVTGYTNEDAQDAAAALILSGDHNNITWTYNDANDKLSSTVDLSVYIGEISADGFRGNLVGDDSTILVKALNSSINLDGTIKGNVIPDLTSVRSLGSEEKRFKRLYVEGTAEGGLWVGSAQIIGNNNVINLPAGSLIGGQPIGTEQETLEGFFISDVKGSLFGDDSSIIVDAISRSIRIESLSAISINGFNDPLSTNSVELRFNDDVQERLTLYSDTDGDYGESAVFQIRSFVGSIDNQTSTSPGNVLGGLQITGLTDGGYKASTVLMSSWDSTADLNTDFPSAKLEIFIGNNTNDEQPAIFTLDYRGVFEAPVIKTASYTSATLPASPESGWIVFDTTTQKYKGYVTDTGLAGGGASNEIPGWVDLN